MKSSALHGSGVISVAEQQMRNWALGLEAREKLRDRKVPGIGLEFHPYIALSREAGVNASEIASAVALAVKAKVFDRELLNAIAERFHLSPATLEFVDEKAASWYRESLGKWLDKQLTSQAEYVHQLGRIVLTAAQHERAVFVGRGAQFYLPRRAGLAVRVVAPRAQRIELYAELHNCNPREAARQIETIDKGRADFVRQYFNQDVSDARLYDLVINLEHIARPAAETLIAEAFRLRFEKR